MTITEFTKGANDWNNHLFLMWLALEDTHYGDVAEMGMGDGSTGQLHDYCKANHRMLYSFETDEQYMAKFIHLRCATHEMTRIINDWHIAKDICPKPSVILIDHAPGERRIVDVKRFADDAGILVLHDTQPQPTAADYGWDRIWGLFKYRVDLICPVNPEPAPDGSLHNRTWASAVSNHYDITKWKGLTFNNGDYVIR